MKLGTLLVIGVLVLGGVYVKRNAHDWMNRIHNEEAHVTAELKQRLNSEEARVQTALSKRVAREKARAAAALKRRVARERAQAAAARRAAGSKAQRITTTSAPPQVGTTSPAGMDEAAFWRLISETRNAAGNDTSRSCSRSA